MADGLNKKFLNNPIKFLENHLILITRFQTGFPESETPFIENFTFRYAESGGVKQKAVYFDERQRQKKLEVVELGSYYSSLRSDNLSRHKRSHAIRAHYLPYKSKRAVAVHLTDDPGFMFTHTLTGCSIVITDDGPQKHVLHVAGNLDAAASKAEIIRKIGQRPYQIFKEEQYDSAETVTVIGIKTPAQGWSFFGQGYDPRFLFKASNPHVCLPDDVEYVRIFSNIEI